MEFWTKDFTGRTPEALQLGKDVTKICLFITDSTINPHDEVLDKRGKFQVLPWMKLEAKCPMTDGLAECVGQAKNVEVDGYYPD